MSDDINPLEVSKKDNETSNTIDKAHTPVPTVTLLPGILPITEPAPMQSFFRPRKQRPLPDPVGDQNDTTASLAPRPSIRAQGNRELYNVLQSPYSLGNSTFDEALPHSSISASASRFHVDQYSNTVRSSSNDAEDAAAILTPSTSSPFTGSEVATLVATAPLPLHVEGMLTATAVAKPGPLSHRVSTPPADRPAFLFGNGGDDLDRGRKSDYFDKIKDNPYASSLLPRGPSPSVPIPQNATEARDLYKKGRYNLRKPDPVPQHTVEDFQQVLKNLRKRFAKIKVMCETAGIGPAGEVWERTIGIVERDRPNIKAALDEDTGMGLKEYTEGLERWDKAVGHHAIFMKRMNYQEQIATLEKKIKEAKRMVAEDGRDGDGDGDGAEIGQKNGGEWKGHKTRLGRRFSGLIEKN